MSTFLNISIAILALIDMFFVTYAIGLNSRHVKVVDQSLAPKPAPISAPPVAPVSTPPPPVVPTSSAESSSVTSASVSAGSFTDLGNTDKRLQPSLIKAADAGILDPTQDQQFRPNDPVTRADFTRWMVRTRQVEPAKPDTPSYTDVDAANPYYGDIEGATKLSYMQGYTVKGSTLKDFKPAQNITRQEFAVMYGTFSGKRGRAEKLSKDEIEQYLRYNPAASAVQQITYKDVGDVDDWARKWVAVANQAGVLEQCFDVNPYSITEEKRYFHPHKMMTRAEAVNILVKLYGAESRKAVQEGAAPATGTPSAGATPSTPSAQGSLSDTSNQSTTTTTPSPGGATTPAATPSTTPTTSPTTTQTTPTTSSDSSR